MANIQAFGRNNNGFYLPGTLDDGPSSQQVFVLNTDYVFSHSTGTGDVCGFVFVADKDYINVDIKVSVKISAFTGSPGLRAELRNAFVSGSNSQRPQDEAALGASASSTVISATGWNDLVDILNVSLTGGLAYFIGNYGVSLGGDTATIVLRGELDGIGATSGGSGTLTPRGYTEENGWSTNSTTIGNGQPTVCISVDGTPFGFPYVDQIADGNDQDYRGNSYIFDNDVEIIGMGIPGLVGFAAFDAGDYGIWPSDSASEIIKIVGTQGRADNLQIIRFDKTIIDAGREVHFMYNPTSNNSNGLVYDMGTGASGNSVVTECGFYKAAGVSGTLGSIVSAPTEIRGLAPLLGNLRQSFGKRAGNSGGLAG